MQVITLAAAYRAGPAGGGMFAGQAQGVADRHPDALPGLVSSGACRMTATRPARSTGCDGSKPGALPQWCTPAVCASK